MGSAIKTMLVCCLLLAACSVSAFAQTPQYYAGETAPSRELIAKNYDRQFGRPGAEIVVIGVHKVNETEYVVLTSAQEKQGSPPAKTVLFNLWRLESREWALQDPVASVIRYVKVLQIDKP
ncbi:MAG: hypothetical protein EG825_13365 [Rhodocyclaceae bacterium]|nr:hypothetical protein [Rhodocyclaceae bacterium]